MFLILVQIAGYPLRLFFPKYERIEKLALLRVGRKTDIEESIRTIPLRDIDDSKRQLSNIEEIH